MNANPEDYDYMSAPLAVLFDRIETATEAGKKLNGLDWADEPAITVMEQDKLPMLRSLGIEFREQVLGDFHENPVGLTVIVLTLILHTDRKNGYAKPLGLAKKKWGTLRWFALLADVIETDENGDVDLRLKDTLAKDLKITVTDQQISDLSISSFIEVTLPARALCRGERSEIFVAEA